MMNHGYLWGLMHNIMVLSMTINSPFFFMRLTPQLITKGRSIVCEHHHLHDPGDHALQRVPAIGSVEDSTGMALDLWMI